MGHIRQELRLVLGGQGELLGFFFQGLTGLFHLGVLSFHLDVLIGEQLGFFAQLLIGLLQFQLLALQLLGE